MLRNALIIRVVILTSITCTLARGQQSGGLEVKYDKFHDSTDVNSQSIVFKDLTLWTTANFAGSVCREKPMNGRLFLLIPYDAWPTVSVEPPVIILLGGSRMKFKGDPDVHYLASQSLDGRLMRGYRMILSLNDIRDLAKAKSLAMKAGSVEVEFSSPQIKMLSDFVAVIDDRCPARE
jgi:hypothetical protein